MRTDFTPPMTDPARQYRSVMNENRRELFEAGARPIAFVCECGDAACAQTVVLTAAEYDLRRADAGVLLAHEPRD